MYSPYLIKTKDMFDEYPIWFKVTFIVMAFIWILNVVILIID